MSNTEKFRAAIRTLERLSAPEQEQEREKALPPEPQPVTPEQVAQAQGTAMLRHLEASRGPSVAIPAVGGLR